MKNTNILDINGTEIQNGDQVVLKDGNQYLGKVVFKDGSFCVKLKIYDKFRYYNLFE